MDVQSLITFVNIPYVQSMDFLFRSTERTYESSISAFNMRMKEYWSDYYKEQEKGRLTIVELEPGEYEFYSWTGSLGGVGGVRNISATEGFSKKFVVAGGKITYVGNLQLTAHGLGIVSRDQKIGYEVKVKDRRENDIPEIFATWAALSKDDLVISIME